MNMVSFENHIETVSADTYHASLSESIRYCKRINADRLERHLLAPASHQRPHVPGELLT